MKKKKSKNPVGNLMNKILPKSSKIRVSLIILASLGLLGAFPYFSGPGLSTPEAISPYANGVFPQSVDIELDATYEVAFPNLTFFYPITFRIIPNQNKVILAQLNGVIKWFDNDETTSVQNTLLDLSGEVGLVSDGGFLGLTIHPEFDAPTNPKNYVYIYYATKNGSGQDLPGFGQYTNQSCDYSENTTTHGPDGEHQGNFLILEKFEIDPLTMTVVPNSRTILLKNRMYGTTHYGGGLEFGNDGFLYLTTGDMASWRRSQNIIDNLEGGVLRLDVDMDPTKSHAPVRKKPTDTGYSDEITGLEYWIPNTNPFSDNTPGSITNLYGQLNLTTPNPTDVYQSGDFFEEYYSIGLRNPFRMTKDSQTGTFYIGDVGLNSQEEIDVLEYGANFGWPEYEGMITGPGCDPNDNLFNNMNHTEPMTAFDRSNANSITGGFVYRGSGIPELFGKYICADYGSGGEIFSIDLDTGEYTQITTLSNIISFGEDLNGELYLLTLGNATTLYKLIDDDVNGGDPPVLLSQTGVFSDLTNLVVNDGFVPYELYESFWSDGALKKRWIAVPNTDGVHSGPNEQINYSEYDDWEFPPGTVVVKHFDLPIDDNNPSITKKIETRFSIVDENGEMYFLTYNWNEQQTDAILQTSSLDEPVDITTTTGGTRTQIWHFPSNSECMDCHNEANKGGLGLKSRYLNTDYDYSTHDPNGQIANQLVTLSHLGILNESITDTDTPNLISNKPISDANATLDDKARSYLDLNCAYCHRHDNDIRTNFDLRYYNSLEATELLTAGILTPLGIDPNEKIVYTGDASKSILHYRMNSVDPTVMMPPLSKSIVDQPAVDLIAAWINQLDANSTNTPNDPNPIINLALLTSAQLSGGAPGQSSYRGSPIDILYDPSIEDYKVTSQYSEYGVPYLQNLGTVNAENGLFWQVDWPNPKFVNYITFGGSYSNQPQPNTMWRVSYLRDGVWNTVEEGQGGWINNSTGNNWSNESIYEWDGTNEAPKVAEAIRVQLFSDGTNDLVSIHLRGRGGNTQFSNGADTDTEPKASLMQFLPYDSPTTIDSIIAGAQGACDSGDNTYSQDLTITYTNAPETGSLLVNGQTFPITVSPQTITLTGLDSDGLDVEVQAEFTDGYKSLYNSLTSVFTAPVDCMNIVIGVDENMTINSNYTVASGGSITILEGGTLTINGNLTVNGDIILNSISNKFSSLIVTGSSIGNITYKRHVNDFNGSTGNDLISSPLTGDNFGDFANRNPNLFENPSTPTQKLFGPFDETTGTYSIYSTVTNATTNFVSGMGYRAARDSSEDATHGTTLSFFGIPETSSVTRTITTSASSFDGWNLVGNPYSSYIDFDTFFDLNKSQLDVASYQAVYGYDGNANDGWTILNNVTTNNLIAPGQGFFVKSKSGGGTITFTPAMRTGGSSDDFIQGRTPLSHIGHLKLEISANALNFNTDIYFNNNASAGLDPGYDAAIYAGSLPNFSIYTTLVQDGDGTAYAIQALGSTDMNNVIIPLGVHASQGQAVTFSVAETDIPDDINIYLEDTDNNTFTLLNSGDYTFTPNTDLNGTGRFYLRIQNTVLSTTEPDLDDLNIFANKNEKTIVIAGQLENETIAKLYDIHGRAIVTHKLDIYNSRQNIDVRLLSAGIYIIELESVTSEKRIQKLIIR